MFSICRLLHGRVQPLEGDYFDNIFVHWTPPRPGKETVWEGMKRRHKLG